MRNYVIKSGNKTLKEDKIEDCEKCPFHTTTLDSTFDFFCNAQNDLEDYSSSRVESKKGFGMDCPFDNIRFSISRDLNSINIEDYSNRNDIIAKFYIDGHYFTETSAKEIAKTVAEILNEKC